MAKTPAWQRAEGKNPKGGLNAKGRASYNAANPGKPGLKPPQPEGGARKKSFCARMEGMKKKLTSSKTANDPNSRINKSLRAWKCYMETGTLVWNLITSFLVGLVMFMVKQASDEQKRIQILLNRTREEIARDHITRAEVRQDLEKIMERFDSGFERLEAKIDALAKGKQ